MKFGFGVGRFGRLTARVATLLALAVSLATGQAARAGVEDCLEAAYSAANPEDLKRAAAFATNHASCLPKLVPPELVPYIALSGSLDAANASGALGPLGFGKSYGQCVAKLDPGKTAVKALSPVLKPICAKSGLSSFLKCSDLEGAAANELNAKAASKIPILSMIPCACAAATSGLGVEKLKDLIEKTRNCGAALAQIGAYLGEGAKGAYKTGKKFVEKTEQFVEDTACAVAGAFGGCSKALPPNGQSEAAKFCAREGSTVKSLFTASNRPDDFSVVCNNNAGCVVKPGQKPRCQTAAEYQTYLERMRTENEAWCRQKRDQLHAAYVAKCRDDKCRLGAGLVAASLSADCVKAANNGKDPFGEPSVQPASQAWPGDGKYTTSLDRLVAESILRDPKASRPEVLAAHGCKPFLGRDLEALCPAGAAFSACKAFVDKNEMRACRETGNAGATYVSKAAANPGANLADRLRLNGCKPFLGRAGEWLCTEAAGLSICNEARTKGEKLTCRSGTSAPK
jgi:hypothetical protein